MNIKRIDIEMLRLDGGTQARERMDQSAIDEYALAMKEGQEFPPVVVFQDADTYWLGDGFHRVAAHLEAFGSSLITADVRPGGVRDAKLFAAGANGTHGLRRTNADKRKAVSLLLLDPEWSKWSNREIAKRCAVSPDMVDRMRSPRVPVTGTPKVVTVTPPKGVPLNDTPGALTVRGEVVADPSSQVPVTGTPKGGIRSTPLSETGRPQESATLSPAPKPGQIEVRPTLNSNEDNNIEPREADLGPAPKSMAEPLEDVQALKDRISALEAELEGVREQSEEMAHLMKDTMEENDSMRRILDAEDLLARFDEEVKIATARTKVVETRMASVQGKNHYLADVCKHLKRKVRKLERRVEELGGSPESDAPLPPPPTDDPDWFTRETEVP